MPGGFGGNLGFNPGAWSWEPPGVQGDPQDYNLVPDPNGGGTIYPPGEPAPADKPTFSNPEWPGRKLPTQDEMDQAVLNWFIPGIGPVRGTVADVGAKYGSAGGGETEATGQERLAAELLARYDALIAENTAYNRGESSRRFGITEQRLSAADRAAADRARAQTAATEAGTAAQRQSAAERLAFERQSLGVTTADRERSQRIALAQALLGLSTGPNGPANRRMALDLLSGLGVNTAGGQGGGSTQPPNLIPPALWDALPPGAKTLLTNAWEAQGGNPGDFQFAINQQRPQGQPSAPAQVRYAAPVGA